MNASEQALAIDPYDLNALACLSKIYIDGGRADEARPLLARAAEWQPETLLASDPSTTEFERTMILAIVTKIIATLTVCHWQIGDLSIAHSYAKAVSQQCPANLGLISLALGDYATGWTYWDYNNTASAGLPWWNGETDWHVLVIDEDYGYGDTIMMARFVPMLAGRCAKLTFHTRPSLRRLMQQTFPDIEIVEEMQGDYDCQVRLCSLPRVFEVRPETVPGEPYLRADPYDRQGWVDRLASLGGRKVGLCWTGSSVHQMDHLRSIRDPRILLPLKDADVSFVALDQGGKMPFPMFACNLADFADTAALLTTLDLVISVDTAVINLAGALGVPAWLLNYSPGDWRWGIEGERSPWYPSVRIFRQPAFGDWGSVIRRVLEAL